MKQKTIFVLACLTLFSSFSSAKNINDSLVANLSCNSISAASILSRVRPTAFSSDHHLPIHNWAFKSGGIGLAACWGMASTQRKLFYLLRLEEASAKDVDVKNALDIIRGATVTYLADFDNPMNNGRMSEQKLKTYSVIPLTEKNINDEWSRNNAHSFLEKIVNGISFTEGGQQIGRNFRTEVERSQELHFYRPSNIGMGAGSGPRSPRENAETVRNLMQNMTANRLSLVNLRLKATVQHVVIPKSFTTDAKGNVWIKAYDSNQPEKDQLIYYAKDSAQFYSPQIMGSFVGDHSGTDYTHPLGVFIVDEEERGYIENTLVKYYQGVCAR